MQQKSLCDSSDQHHFVVSLQLQQKKPTSFIIVWNARNDFVLFFIFKLGMCEFCPMAKSLYLICAIKVFIGSSFHLQSELSPLVRLPLLVFTGGGCQTSSCARSFCSQLIIIFLMTLRNTRQQHWNLWCFLGSLCFCWDRRGRRQERNM